MIVAARRQSHAARLSGTRPIQGGFHLGLARLRLAVTQDPEKTL